ncbi:hypothetical protein [Novilysobacter selenitireducens]|uniref:Uncharacterized protein n=1 Tax=Novilysobacter selenitireducens TaxID=2872639 RepID=A0ABS7T6Z1_9GAMM|nr:hypothetical protein [Lysobacter selenitireducens]MBZ4039654.1 hypothetical protein [Lysobacter selenitireducens]
MPQTPDLAPVPHGFDAPPPRDLAHDWTTRRVRSRQAWTDAKAANSEWREEDAPAAPQPATR